MILSISRRTDIPAFYSKWLVNRFEEGYVLVRNPMNYHQVSRVDLSPERIDCLVFWTKDPQNIIPELESFSKYQYYFLITVTPYGKDIERNVRPKRDIVESIKTLSGLIGPDRIIWRYDPIILTEKYNLDYHEEHFWKLIEKLNPYCHKCVISFLDVYAKTRRNMVSIDYKEIDECDMKNIAKRLSGIAAEFGMPMETCSEAVDLSEYGIQHGKCIDDRLVSKLNNYELAVDKDPNQRDSCGCVKSIDIGAYNSCRHNCLYCYANFSEKAFMNNISKHDDNSPFLIGASEPEDVVNERRMVKDYI